MTLYIIFVHLVQLGTKLAIRDKFEETLLSIVRSLFDRFDGLQVSLSISILLSLTVFFLLLAEIIPPTSLVVPLLGKFVLFTMILDTFRYKSFFVVVVFLSIHHRLLELCFRQYMRHGRGPERPLPVASDPRYGAMGSTRLHPRSAAIVGDAQVSHSTISNKFLPRERSFLCNKNKD